jgi:hypothetical protein
VVVRVEEGLLGRRDALLLGIVFSATTPALLAPAGALADEATAGTAAPTLSVLVVVVSMLAGVSAAHTYYAYCYSFGRGGWVIKSRSRASLRTRMRPTSSAFKFLKVRTHTISSPGFPVSISRRRSQSTFI